MYKREGYVIHGRYVGGEWCEDTTYICEHAKSKKKLKKKVEKLTKQESSDGSSIDFGFVSNTKKVVWNNEIIKYKKLPA